MKFHDGDTRILNLTGMGARKEDNLIDDVVAWQSSTKKGYRAEKAVDENKKTCAKTDSQPVFRLDLKRPYVIHLVIVISLQEKEHYEKNR